MDSDFVTRGLGCIILLAIFGVIIWMLLVIAIEFGYIASTIMAFLLAVGFGFVMDNVLEE